MKLPRWAAVFITAALILTVIPIYNIARADMKPVYVVSTTSVYLRAGIGTSYESLCVLNEGEEVMLLDSSKVWYKVRTRNRITGYVAPNYIKYIRDEKEDSFGIISQASLPDGVGPGDIYEVTAENIALRKTASSTGVIISKQTRGALLTCLEKLPYGWIKIRTVSGLEAYTSIVGMRFVGTAVSGEKGTPAQTATPAPASIAPSTTPTASATPAATVKPTATPIPIATYIPRTPTPAPSLIPPAGPADDIAPTEVVTQSAEGQPSGSQGVIPEIPDWDDKSFTIDASYQKYAYETMVADLNKLARQYPETIRLYSVGTTVWGQQIPAAQVGNPNAADTILVHASIHAREYMTTQVLMRQIEYYAANPEVTYNGITFKEILDRVCIWFVPMANPDGVYLSQVGVAEMQDLTLKQSLIKMNKGSADFTKWKANGRGVDLNSNFDANWRPSSSITAPASENYPGTEAESEPESQVLVALTYDIDAKMSISYHSRGSFMYWFYGQDGENKTRDYKLGTELSKLTGYWMMPESGSMGGRGFKDWFVQRLGRPGFTIEIGSSKTEAPQPSSEFPDIWKRNALTSIHLAWRAIDMQMD